MLNVIGIVSRMTNAGIAVSSCSKSTLAIWAITRKPTRINAGAVAAAGTMPAVACLLPFLTRLFLVPLPPLPD
jgi:hypothetical protein